MDSKCCEQIELEGLIRWRHTPLPHACYFPANPLPPRNTSRIKINNSCSPNLEGTREHTDTERLTRLQKKPPPPETIRCASLAAFSQKQHQTRLPGKNRPDCFILSAVKIKLFFFPDVWLLCWVFSPSLLVLQVISVFSHRRTYLCKVFHSGRQQALNMDGMQCVLLIASQKCVHVFHVS